MHSSLKKKLVGNSKNNLYLRKAKYKPLLSGIKQGCFLLPLTCEYGRLQAVLKRKHKRLRAVNTNKEFKIIISNHKTEKNQKVSAGKYKGRSLEKW